MTAPAPALAVRGVSRRYGARLAVADAGFELHAGRIACLVGPSGCGKSTLLRLIAGLEPVDAGEIAIAGETVSSPGATVPPERRGVGLVFQDCALFPHLNVTDNVGFGLPHLPAAARRARALDLLARFHADALADAWPHTLSGGEQQRVAIARALAREPAVLLLDEPFSGLDGHLRAQIRQSVLADLRAAGTTVLIVTHDPEEAMLIADDLILMAEGRVLQTGSPEDCYANPATATAARLLGEAILLPAMIAGGVAETPLGPVPATGIADGSAIAMLRPHDIRLGDTGVEAMVTGHAFAGARRQINVSLAGATLTLPATTTPADGTTVRLAADPAAIRIFADRNPLDPDAA